MAFLLKVQHFPNSGLISQSEHGSIGQALAEACRKLQTDPANVWIEDGATIVMGRAQIDEYCKQRSSA